MRYLDDVFMYRRALYHCYIDFAWGYSEFMVYKRVNKLYENYMKLLEENKDGQGQSETQIEENDDIEEDAYDAFIAKGSNKAKRGRNKTPRKAGASRW